MALSKKNLRKIIVDDIEYVYKISSCKSTSDLRVQNEELHQDFMKFANYYGLGEVIDVKFNLLIKDSAESSISFLLVKYNSIIASGFMGFEQFTTITPKLIRYFIKSAKQQGWKVEDKKNYQMEFVEKFKDGKLSTLFQIKNREEVLIKNY